MLPKVAVCIAAGELILSQVWLLEIRAAAHEQQLQCICAGVPVQLGSGAGALTKIVKFHGLRRVEIAA